MEGIATEALQRQPGTTIFLFFGYPSPNFSLHARGNITRTSFNQNIHGGEKKRMKNIGGVWTKSLRSVGTAGIRTREAGETRFNVAARENGIGEATTANPSHSIYSQK